MILWSFRGERWRGGIDERVSGRRLSASEKRFLHVGRLRAWSSGITSNFLTGTPLRGNDSRAVDCQETECWKSLDGFVEAIQPKQWLTKKPSSRRG